MSSIIENLLIVSAQTSVLVTLAMFFRLIFRKTYKVFAYIMWLIILLRLCVPIQIESPYGVISLDWNSQEAENVGEIKESHEQSEKNDWHGDLPVYVYEERTEGNVTIISPTIQNNTAIEESDAENIILFTKEQIAMLVWIVGMAVVTSLAVVQMVLLKKRTRMAIHIESDIWECEGISTAFVMGFFKAKIYIPAYITSKEREYILMHERMHIRHGDHIVRIVMLVVNILYWWNPFVWIAIHFMKRDMEMFCDESVIKSMETDGKKEYLRTLLNCSAKNSGIIPVMSFGESNTERRIRHIMNLKKPKFYIFILLSIFVLVCYSGCIVKPDNINSDILPDVGTEDNTGSESERETTDKADNTTTTDRENDTEEQETLYEEWLAMHLPGFGFRMKYPANDASDNLISITADVSPNGAGLDLGMLFFINGVPQQCVDSAGNMAYISKFYVDAGETVNKDLTCAFNNVMRSDEYVCRGAMMTSPDTIVTSKKSIVMGFLQDVRGCGAAKIECNQNDTVDVGILKGKKIKKEDSESKTDTFMCSAFKGQFFYSNVLERKSVIGEYMLEFTPDVNASYIISFWGNGAPVKVGEHMYYQVDLEVGDKYQYTFELDEQLVNSVDNFYAIVVPIGTDGFIDKTQTVIFTDEYGK